MRSLASSLHRARRASWISLVALLLAVGLTTAGCDDDGGVNETPDPTITELAQSESDLSTLVSALQAAGLAETLNEDDGPFTVFAPVNSAFGAIDAGELTDNSALLDKVLRYHVVGGQAITSDQISDGQTVINLAGDDLTFAVDNGTVTVNGAAVTTVDLEASNGVVHLIDTVMLQGTNAVERATLTPQLSTTTAAIEAAGLGGALSGDGPFTIFAPVDPSFDGLEVETLTGDTDLLTRILQLHVISGSRIRAADISDGQTATTLEGSDLTFGVQDGTVTVNGATVTTANVETENATIHLIDRVLLQEINAVERAVITESFSILEDLVIETGLDGALSGPGPDGMDGLTVFAPTNTAFLDALDANDNGQIDDSEVPSNASDILQYHVVDDVYFAADVPTTETALPTLEGSDVTVVRDGSNVTVNPNDENASVAIPDVEVSNGVIHAIDSVLLPPSN